VSSRYRNALPQLGEALFVQYSTLSGCCGTDHRHVQRIAAACAPLFKVAA